MMRKTHLLLWLLIGGLLAACSAPEPTQTPTPSFTPSNTPFPTVTLPPTWTPGNLPTVGRGEVQPPPDTPTPESISAPGAATLPPTWTPEASITAPTQPPAPTLRPTLTPAARRTESLGVLSATLVGAPPTIAPDRTFSPACSTFTRSTPTTTLIADRATDAQVTWTPVEGAEGYYVWLRSPSNRYDFVGIVEETTVTFERALFGGLGNYAWEVMPLQNGERFCQSLTGVIVVRFGN